MLSEIHPKHVQPGLFRERVGQPVDERDPRRMVFRVEHELGRVELSCRVEGVEPERDFRHERMDALLSLQRAECKHVAPHAHQTQVVVDGHGLAARPHVPLAFGPVRVP